MPRPPRGQVRVCHCCNAEEILTNETQKNAENQSGLEEKLIAAQEKLIGAEEKLIGAEGNQIGAVEKLIEAEEKQNEAEEKLIETEEKQSNRDGDTEEKKGDDDVCGGENVKRLDCKVWEREGLSLCETCKHECCQSCLWEGKCHQCSGHDFCPIWKHQSLLSLLSTFISTFVS